MKLKMVLCLVMLVGLSIGTGFFYQETLKETFAQATMKQEPEKPQGIGTLPGTWLVETKSGNMYEAQIRCLPVGVVILGIQGDRFIPADKIKSLKQVEVDADTNPHKYKYGRDL